MIIMTFWAFSAVVNGITSATIGILVYIKNRNKPLKLSYLLFCLTVALWSCFYYLWQMSRSEMDALFWSRSLMASAIFIPVCYLHHIYILLGIYEKRKREIILSYIFTFIALSISFSPLFVRSVEPKLWFMFWPNPC